ncbi:MAG: hypothetical protein ACLQVJ_03380 [Syntrophobacteraceae bacterium]
MGIDFIPVNREKFREGFIDLSTRDWDTLRRMALDNGWEPTGTVDPYGGEANGVFIEWDGGYHTSDFQLVLEEDLMAMTDALERAIADRDERSIRWIRYFIDEFRKSGGITLG